MTKNSRFALFQHASVGHFVTAKGRLAAVRSNLPHRPAFPFGVDPLGQHQRLHAGYKYHHYYRKVRPDRAPSAGWADAGRQRFAKQWVCPHGGRHPSGRLSAGNSQLCPPGPSQQLSEGMLLAIFPQRGKCGGARLPRGTQPRNFGKHAAWRCPPGRACFQ